MARSETLVQLTDELVGKLDREASQRNCSRSALIRLAVERFLDAESIAAKEAAWIEGYRRVPQYQPDELGDLAAQLDAARRAMSARLDAEEEAAGWSW
jgi:Ribbon-helix-helix protein, copG family